MTEPEYLHIPIRRARVSYSPESPDPPSDPRLGFFQPRPRRPQRIHIVRVAADSPVKRTPSRKNTALTFGKLAESRSNAKRFLRSFISLTHNAASEEPPSGLPGTDDPRRKSAPVLRPEGEIEGTDNMRPATIQSPANTMAARPHRPSLVDSVRTGPARIGTGSLGTGALPNLPELDKVASGNGVSVGINLAEPVLFLQGFEQTDTSTSSTAMLRGSLHLRVTKSAKIRAVTLKFKGRATTKWPEGIPPKKVEFEETDSIMSHTWPFFNAQFPTAEVGTCADHVELYSNSASTQDSGISKHRASIDTVHVNPNDSSTNLGMYSDRRLSLRVNQSRSFGKGDSSTNGPSVAQKGYRTFNPGDYIYNFELPLDSHLPETIDVELGSVRYELEATVERAGAFKTNLLGTKEVVLIRAPSEGSLEQVEPIAISRNWEDQLHYDIVISGKSFPLGTQVPIAFKLTPLAKVQCHRIKVFITENIEYYCHNKRVHRMEPTRKVQLFEKRAEGPATSTYPGSTMRIISGGGVPYDQRAAAARGEEVNTNSTNLLGDLEGQVNIGPTEMEFSVQLPSCMNIRDKERSHKLHFDTTYQNIQVHHWIKIVMRLSKPDQNDPAKRRHFEISIDSPFHILSCQASYANTSLPSYSSPEPVISGTRLYECGCPGAAPQRGSSASFQPTVNSLNSSNSSNPLEAIRSPGLTRPQQAHLGGPINQNLQRPIHMMRAPSFNPPAFEADEPPPPMETPPPQYDSIASPTSGLADYFSRLSDAYDDDSETEGPTTPRGRGRVNVPLTPGGRVNRSLDEQRSWLPVGH